MKPDDITKYLSLWDPSAAWVEKIASLRDLGMKQYRNDLYRPGLPGTTTFDLLNKTIREDKTELRNWLQPYLNQGEQTGQNIPYHDIEFHLRAYPDVVQSLMAIRAEENAGTIARRWYASGLPHGLHRAVALYDLVCFLQGGTGLPSHRTKRVRILGFDYERHLGFTGILTLEWITHGPDGQVFTGPPLFMQTPQVLSFTL